MKKRNIAALGAGVLATGILALGCSCSEIIDSPQTVYGPPEWFEDQQDVYGPPPIDEFDDIDAENDEGEIDDAEAETTEDATSESPAQ